MGIKFRFEQDTRYVTGKRDILGPNIAEICKPFPIISPNVNSTTQPKGKGKGKAIPVEAWTDPEGYRRLRFPDSMTVGAWRWWSCKHRPPLPPHAAIYSWYSFLSEAESNPGPYCGRKDYVYGKFQLMPSGVESANLRLVSRCLKQLRHRVHHTNKGFDNY